MKTKITCLTTLLFAVVLFVCTAQYLPRNSNAFITDIQSFLGIPSDRGLGNTVYIGTRNDAKAGSGTAEDVFNGGTTSATFDAIWANASKTPANSDIYVMPGTYLTKGIVPRDGWKIHISPKAILKLDVITAGDVAGGIFTNSAHIIAMFGKTSSTLFQDILIEGGTWDLNMQNQVNTTVCASAIAYIGDGLIFRNAKIINWGTTVAGAPEEFVCGIFSDGLSYSRIHDKGVVWDNLEFTQPAAGITNTGTITLINANGGQNVKMDGTLAAVNGTANIVGTGTKFTTALSIGMHILIGTTISNGVDYIINTISDDTHLTITTNYTGSTLSALIGVGGGPSNGWFRNVTVKNCFFHDITITDGISIDCINLGGWVKGFHGHHNRFVNITGNNARYGYYWDTGSGEDILIDHDQFINTTFVLDFNHDIASWNRKKIKIDAITANKADYIGVNIGSSVGINTDVTVSNCDLYFVDAYGISAYNINGIHVKNNTVDMVTYPPNAIVLTSNTNVDRLGNVRQNGSSLDTQVYRAILNQSGGAAPVATVTQNSFNGSIVWTRNSPGNYIGTLTGAFTASKTWINAAANVIGASTPQYVHYTRTSADVVTLTTSNGSANVDSILVDQPIEIMVYP